MAVPPVRIITSVIGRRRGAAQGEGHPPTANRPREIDDVQHLKWIQDEKKPDE
jgi:hypothetical protein